MPGMNPLAVMARSVERIQRAQEYSDMANPVSLIDPTTDGRMERLTERTFGVSSQDLMLDSAKFVFHKIGRIYTNGDSSWRTLYFEIPNCPYRCDYCYVNPRNLNWNMESAWTDAYRNNPKNMRAQQFVGRSVFTPAEMDAYVDEVELRSAQRVEAVEIGSGEPLSNFMAIAELARLFKKKPGNVTRRIELDTTGLPLVINPDLVEKFAGFAGCPGVINFYLSLFKGRNAQEHLRVTHAESWFWDSGPKVAKWLLANGFWVFPAGIATPIFGHPNPQDLETVTDNRFVRENDHGERYFTDAYYELKATEAAEFLHKQMLDIHPLAPRLLRYHGVTKGNNVEDSEHQRKMMRKSGFWIESRHLVDAKGKPKLIVNTRPGVFKQALKAQFCQTPLIGRRAKIYEQGEYRQVMAQVIEDLSKRKAEVRQELINYRRIAYKRRSQQLQEQAQA